MQAKVEIVTVAQAKELLERNTLNRAISRATVERYAADMKSGRWNNNGQGIVISATGNLLDGQHRMHAIVQAQMPISMLVVRGADPATFITMDTGKPRNLADVLSIEGHVHTNTLAGMARASFAYASGAQFSYSPTTATLEEYIKKHPYMLDIASMVGAKARRWPKAPLAAVLFLGNESRNLDEEVKNFFEGVIYGEGLWKGDARLTLRDWLAAQRTHDRGRRGVVRTETVFAAVGRAWNAFAAGKELTVLKALDKPTRNSLPIFGFDRTLYQEVPDVPLKVAEIRRSNLSKDWRRNETPATAAVA